MVKKPLACAVCGVLTMPMTVMADVSEDEPNVVLENITITLGKQQAGSGFAFKDTKKASDITVSKDKLKHRSATLGNALSDELGVHSNPFGGGASAPVIRGQDGARVKILQNGTDVIDVSALSPDHVVATDTLLANKVELVRGASTLLYGTASMAGVVNVIDGRIPDAMPQGTQGNFEGEAMLRYNTSSQEKLATAGVSVGVGERVAVRVEGLARNAKDYKVPEFQSDVLLKHLPDSYNKSVVGTIGASWIGDKGYIGASYSHRKDKYGIPGHNHNYDSCEGHFIDWYGKPGSGVHGRYYLDIYPHLMDDDDIVDFPHFDACRTESNGEDHGHSHDSPFGFDHNHNHDGPWVDMKSKRWDLRGEINQPIKGIDKARLSLTHADYYHDEKDPGNSERTTGIDEGLSSAIDRGHAAAIFKNKGTNARFEMYHTPIGNLKGLLGVQYQSQDLSASTPYLPSYGAGKDAAPRHLLVPHNNKTMSVFGVEQYKIGNVALELSARYEKQKTAVQYDHDLIKNRLEWHEKNAPAIEATRPTHPDLSPYKQSALSYAGSVIWDVTPKYRLSATVSHNERIPAPMELYYHGKHLATNSFEYGNKKLTPEKSNNYELGLSYRGDKWDYNVSGYLSDFDNYIFNENIAKFGNLYMRRYNQTTAKIYGLEADSTYYFKDNQSLTFFGDFVRGKIGNLSPVVGKALPSGTKHGLIDNADEARVDEDGYSVPPVNFIRGKFVPNPDYDDAISCSSKTADEWHAINEDSDCLTSVNVYKNGTTTPSSEDFDTLARPATNAPRIPPARLGVRYRYDINGNWTLSGEYSHVFAQNRTSTSTIAIKPSDTDDNGKKRQYDNPANTKVMYPRHIHENKTAGYNLLNIGVDYQNTLGNYDYTLSLRANNLLNEKIYIHNSFLPFVPQMGRNATISATIKF